MIYIYIFLVISFSLMLNQKSVFCLMRIFIIFDLIDPPIFSLLIEDKRKEKFVEVLILWIVKLRIISKCRLI